MLSSEVSNVRELSSLAKLYVERDLKVAPVAAFYRTPLILMARAEKEVVEESPLVSLRELMKANMPLGKYDDAIVLLGQLVRSVRLDDNDMEAQDSIVETESPPTKRKRKDGDDNFEEKNSLKEITDPMQKLEKFFDLHQSVLDGGRQCMFTNAARVFFNQRIACIVSCVNNHFDGNKQSFLNVHGNSLMKKYSKFYKEHCKGKGNSCSH